MTAPASVLLISTIDDHDCEICLRIRRCQLRGTTRPAAYFKPFMYIIRFLQTFSDNLVTVLLQLRREFKASSFHCYTATLESYNEVLKPQ